MTSVGAIKVGIVLEQTNKEFMDKLNAQLAKNVHADDDPELEILQTIVGNVITMSGETEAGNIRYVLDWEKVHDAYLDELGLV